MTAKKFFMIGVRRGLRWLYAKAVIQAQRFVLRILSAGPIPKHVAFIMDGNRRYARLRNQKVQMGHAQGFVALRKILELCLRLNVRCVSVYAFALDNFNRPPEEVEALMDLAETKLIELCKHGDLLDQYGVRLNVLGRKELFPESVQKAIAEAEEMTRHNNRSILNVCMAYGSTDEITTAVNSSVRIALKKNRKHPKISYEDIESQLMTSKVGSPPVDILIRSSGVARLSDFFTWQCCDTTQIYFSDAYWPDFGLRDLIPIIISYQKHMWNQPVSARRS